MASEHQPDLEAEIAHVLLLDVVGYSKLLVEDQVEVLGLLNRIVRETPRFSAAASRGKLVRVPTGDGMALLFFDSPEAPVQCALEISKSVREHPQLKLRMGAHSGPIKAISDVNDQSNVAGAGINLAQRVLDCGDAEHILLSARLAEDLMAYRHWQPFLHDLGECEVKHGVRLRLYNLCKDGLGNRAVPQTVKRQQARLRKLQSATTRWIAGSSKRRVALLGASGTTLVALAAAGWFLMRTSPVPISPIADKSIAVLPFGNLSTERENAYFAEGMQDEILTDLSRVADIKVISRTSVMQYRAAPERNVREIAKTLSVAHVLEGSVQRVGNRIRVHAQLIDARTDRHVWASRYDRELADVFAIQSEVAQEIVAQLKTRLSPQEKATIAEPPTDDLGAYEFYLRAKRLIETAVLSAQANDELKEAVALLTKAVERDPNFALAFYQLAHAHDQLYRRFEQSSARLALANSAIQSLQRLRPDSGEAHLALAKHLYWGYRDYERARQELAAAQRALPNDPVPPLLTGYIDRRQGRWDDATRHLHRALELDPRNPQNPSILQQISLIYFTQQRFPEMGAALDRALALTPEDSVLRAQRAAVELEWRGDTRPLRAVIDSIVATSPAAARAIADQWVYLALCERDPAAATRAMDLLGEHGCHTEGIPFPRSWCDGQIARLLGDADAARAAFTRTREEGERLVAGTPQWAGAACVLAMAHAGLGNKEEAMREGQRAVALVPIEEDAIIGTLLVENLAIVYAWIGERELALGQLAIVTSMPSYLSYGNLRLHPNWDPLRGDPGFEQIVASLAPKD